MSLTVSPADSAQDPIRVTGEEPTDVVEVHEEEAPPPIEVAGLPARPASPLAGLKEKLAAAKADLHIDLEVPRFRGLGVRVFVRYRPLDPSLSAEMNERFEKTKAKDWQMQSLAQMLVACCVEVYGTEDIDPVDEAERERFSLSFEGPDAPLTKFDAHLAVTLGMIEEDEVDRAAAKTSALKVCRELYWTEGDLRAAAFELTDWSGLTSSEASRDFQTP